MIKLTDFNAAVDTYKKNFLIRKKRFKNTQTQASVQKRAKRENRIEIGKFAKRVGGGFAKKFKPTGGDFLNDLLRFAGFTILGLIVANIDKIAIALKNTIEKIKEVANDLRIFYEEKVKPFFETVYNSAKSAYEAIKGISDFFIDVNPLNEFSDLLDIVMYGILGMGYKMGSLNAPKKPKPPKPPAKTPTKTPVKTPAKVPAKTLSRTPAKTTAPARTIAKTFAPSIPVTAGRGTGTGTGTGVPKATTAAGMLSDDLLDILKKSSDASIKSAAEEFLKLKESEPFSKGLDPTKDLSKNIDSTSRANFKKFIEALEKEKLKADLKFRGNLGLDTPEGAAAAQQAAMDIKSDLDKGRSLKPGASVLDDLLGVPKPKPTQTLSTFEKLQSQFKYLTKGLDFRIDIKTPIFNAIKSAKSNPKQFALNTLGGGLKTGGTLALGFIIEGLANAIGKAISDSLPYDPKFKTLGYFGLISKERIAATTAQEILDRDADQQVIAIDRLIKAAESTPAFYDLSGQQKKESARAILDAIIKIRASEQKTTKEKLEENAEKIDEALQSRTPLTPELLSQTISFGTNIAFGKQEPSSNTNIAFNPPSRLNTIAQGLDQETTYSNQGMVTIKETLIAIQPIEVPAA